MLDNSQVIGGEPMLEEFATYATFVAEFLRCAIVPDNRDNSRSYVALRVDRA
jgi:hypothetical protein